MTTERIETIMSRRKRDERSRILTLRDASILGLQNSITDLDKGEVNLRQIRTDMKRACRFLKLHA